MISDETTSKLKLAAEISQEREISILDAEMSSAQPHVFSLKFEKKMKKLFELSRKSYYYCINTVGKRIAIIVIVLLTVISTTVFNIKALRDPVVKFFIEMYEKISTVTFGEPENGMEYPAYIERYYEPYYIPEGYNRKLVYKSKISQQVIYSKPNENDVIFSQNTIFSRELKIDTEGNVNIENIFILGNNAIYYENKGIKNLIWLYGEYQFLLSCTCDKDTLIMMAESIK